MNNHRKVAMEKKKSSYITATRAKKEYFLTDSMIKMIGEEDKTVRNSHRRSSYIRLYLIERIEEWVVENADLVEKSKIRREKLSKAQLKVHAEKREKMKELTKSWKPKMKIPCGVSIEEMTEDAKSYYHFRYDDFSGQVTRQGLIAYIRHEYTDYEWFLSEIDSSKGKTGVGLLYPPLRIKVDELISKYLDKE